MRFSVQRSPTFSSASVYGPVPNGWSENGALNEGWTIIVAFSAQSSATERTGADKLSLIVWLLMTSTPPFAGFFVALPSAPVPASWVSAAKVERPMLEEPVEESV